MNSLKTELQKMAQAEEKKKERGTLEGNIAFVKSPEFQTVYRWVGIKLQKFFLKIFHFLERISMERLYIKSSLVSKLQFNSIFRRLLE